MDKIDNIGLTRILTQSYDFDGFTSQEVWSRIAQRMNIIIEHFNYLEKTVQDKQEVINQKLEYLLSQGINDELSKLLLEKIEDGTISKIIVDNVFSELNDSINKNYNTLDNKIKDTITQLNNSLSSNNNSVNSKIDELKNENISLNNKVKTNFDTLNLCKYDNVVFENELLKFYANDNEKKVIDFSRKKTSKVYEMVKSNKKCYKIAHRGLSGAYPENTILAIEKASNYGCDMVEVDLNYTQDNKFILMHDDTLDRTTNGVGNTNSLTLEQIKQLKIDGGNNADIFNTLTVPTLEELLLSCKANNLIPFIELKSQIPTSLCQSIVNIIKSYNMIENVILTSFSEELLNTIRNIEPIITIAPIVDLTLVNVNKYKDYGNIILSVPYPSNFSFDVLKYANEIGLPIVTWTIDDKTSIDLLQSKGIDGIISNTYNNKNNRKFLFVNSSDTTKFIANYTFDSDVAKVTKKDDNTLLITWDIPFYGTARPIAFANEDSGDKIGYVPLTRATQNNSVEVKFRKVGQSSISPISDINTYNVYFSLIVMQ